MFSNLVKWYNLHTLTNFKSQSYPIFYIYIFLKIDVFLLHVKLKQAETKLNAIISRVCQDVKPNSQTCLRHPICLKFPKYQKTIDK